MSSMKVLVLDIPSVMDLSSVDTIRAMRCSMERQTLRDFERAADKKQPGIKGVISRLFESLSENETHGMKPELLRGAAKFLDEIEQSTRRCPIYLQAANSVPVVVKGEEYKPKYFDPYFNAFKHITRSATPFSCTGFTQLGLDVATPATDEQIAKRLKLDNCEKRSDVMIVTDDARRAAKAQDLGYEAVLIENGDFTKALEKVKSFIPVPASPKFGAQPQPVA